MQNRDTRLDMMKGIAICLIVIGHSGSPITHFIYLFHVAVFFMISGIVFNTVYSGNFKSVFSLVMKRLKSLWIPYFITTTFFLLIWNVFVKFHIYDADLKTAKELLIGVVKNALFIGGGGQMSGACWFLSCLFFVTVGYALLDWFFNVIHLKYKKIFHGLVAIAFFTVAYILSLKKISFFHIELILSAWILFVSGRFLSDFDFENLSLKSYVYILILSLCILLICNEYGSVELSKAIYTSPQFYIVAALSGFFFLYSFCALLEKISFIKICFSYLGKHTISIVCLHFLAFKLVTLLQIKVYNLPITDLTSFPVLNTPYWWILYSFVGISVPVLLNLCYNKMVLLFTRLQIGKRNGKI